MSRADVKVWGYELVRTLMRQKFVFRVVSYYIRQVNGVNWRDIM